MIQTVVPMIHVPDVRATTEWYQGIGFTVSDTYGNGGTGLSFAILSFGSSWRRQQAQPVCKAYVPKVTA